MRILALAIALLALAGYIVILEGRFREKDPRLGQVSEDSIRRALRDAEEQEREWFSGGPGVWKA